MILLKHDGLEGIRITGSLPKYGSFDEGPRITKRLTCVNDIELTADMLQLPEDSKKITNLYFLAIRLDIGECLRTSLVFAVPEGDRETYMRRVRGCLGTGI